MDQKYFSDALRTARSDKGLSQAALARAAGVSKQYISLLEGPRPPEPRRPVLHALSLALDIDLAAIRESMSTWAAAQDDEPKPTTTA